MRRFTQWHARLAAVDAWQHTKEGHVLRNRKERRDMARTTRVASRREMLRQGRRMHNYRVPRPRPQPIEIIEGEVAL